jgi:hypothetical protein
MQNLLEKLDSNSLRLQSMSALGPDAPRRHAYELLRAFSERTLEIPQTAAIEHGVVGDAVEDSRARAPAADRKGYFARFLAALHESRRLQAAAVMRRYAHLLQRSGEAGKSDQPGVATGDET